MAEGRYSTLLEKIKKAYVGTGSGMDKLKAGWKWENGQYVKIWSGATVVSYYDGETLLGTEDVDEGEDVLHPSFSTTKENYTLYGWTTEPESFTREESLTAQGDTMTLYAIYLPNVYTVLTGVGSYQSPNFEYTITFIDSNYCGGRFIANAIRAAYIAGGGYQEDNSTFSVTLNGYGKAKIGYTSFVYGYGSTSNETCRLDGIDVTSSSGTKTTTSSGSHSLHAHGNVAAGSNYLNTGVYISSIVLSEPIAWE